MFEPTLRSTLGPDRGGQRGPAWPLGCVVRRYAPRRWGWRTRIAAARGSERAMRGRAGAAPRRLSGNAVWGKTAAVVDLAPEATSRRRDLRRMGAGTAPEYLEQ